MRAIAASSWTAPLFISGALQCTNTSNHDRAILISSRARCGSITWTLSGSPPGYSKPFGPRGADVLDPALELFPNRHELLALKKWHGRGEASLIALYGGTL
jgi:hypothetical protein